jgi:tetratricopeptide (TPR) repeat protein
MDFERVLGEERTVVQLVLIDETGDSYYRMRWPGKALSEQAPNWRVISLDATAQERFEWAERADLLILFQSHDLDLLPLIEKRRAAGKRTIAEYNDNFYDPPVSAPVFEAWSNPVLWQTYERLMTAADAVVVTGPGLKNLFSFKTSRAIHEIRNYLPDSTLPDFESMWPDISKEIRIGWGGSQGHMADLFAFLPVLRQLLAEFPKLKLSIMGNDSIPNYLDIPHDRFQFTPWGSMRQYYQFLEKIHFGFIPLLDTPYNRCRSDIKAVEMASRAVLPIVPELLPYREFLNETRTSGYKNQDDFLEKARAYLRDPSKVQEEARRCYNYVKLGRLQHQHRERLQLCASMMTASPEKQRKDLSKGYFEVRGIPSQHSPSRELLIRVQTLFNNRQRTRAIQVLEEGIRQNPYNPDLALAHLKSLRVVSPQSIAEKAKQYRAIFIGDLRFAMMQIEITADFAERKPIWADILQQLPRESALYRRHFRNQVISAITKEIQDYKASVDIAKQFLEIYPGAAALRFEVGKAYEFQGRNREAHQEFSWLLERQEDFSQDKDFFSTLNVMELKTYAQSLESHS